MYRGIIIYVTVKSTILHSLLGPTCILIKFLCSQSFGETTRYCNSIGINCECIIIVHNENVSTSVFRYVCVLKVFRFLDLSFFRS